jgi:hypothetical protein
VTTQHTFFCFLLFFPRVIKGVYSLFVCFCLFEALDIGIGGLGSDRISMPTHTKFNDGLGMKPSGEGWAIHAWHSYSMKTKGE